MEQQKINIGMKPPHPGKFVKTEILDELGLSISKAAKVLGVRRATLSNLINEKVALSSEMAVCIELAFNVKADMLSRMQAWYDIEEVRNRVSQLGIHPNTG